MTREQRRAVIWTPLATWAGLILLAATTLGYAYWPHAPLKAETGIAIAAAKTLLVAVIFMQLREAVGIVRLAAVAGLVWGSFLYLLAFADVLTR
jgi:cytochrome c oxidase subunit 4